MTTLIREIYEALKAAGVPEDKAASAAEAVAPKGEVATKTDMADLRTDFAALRTEFEVLRTDFANLRTEFEALRTDFAVLRGEVNTLKWMVGFNLAISVALLWKLFAP